MAINRFNTFSPTAAAVPDFFFDVVRGAYGSYYQTVNISGFGRNLSTSEKIINYGGSFEPYESSLWSTIQSNNAQDTAAGEGARTVRVLGVDTNGDLLDQTVTMNGTTAVSFPVGYRYINEVLVVTAGSQQYNLGELKLENTPGGVADINIGPTVGSSQMGSFMVPNGYRMVLMGTDLTFAKADTKCDIIFNLRKIRGIIQGTPVWQTQYRAVTSIDQSHTQGTSAQIRFPILFNPGELALFTAQSSSVSLSWVSAQGYGVLIQDA